MRLNLAVSIAGFYYAWCYISFYQNSAQTGLWVDHQKCALLYSLGMFWTRTDTAPTVSLAVQLPCTVDFATLEAFCLLQASCDTLSSMPRAGPTECYDLGL